MLTTLLHAVEKNEDHPYGLFANIQNDLARYIEKNGFDKTDKLNLMAYGYARRVVAAGLYIQGGWEREMFIQAVNIFQSLQVTTKQTKEFQIKAYEQALELLQSYDNRFTDNMSRYIVYMATNDNIPGDGVKSIDYIFENLERMIQND